MTKQEQNYLIKNLDRDVLIALNPFSMQVAIYFMKDDVTVFKSFGSYDEWLGINHPSKEKESIDLHLYYDDFASLSVYHRHDDVESTYSDGITWQSDGQAKSPNIFIAYTDMEFGIIQRSFKTFEFYPMTRSLTIKN